MNTMFVTASSIRNFMLNDTIVDWLDFMNKKGVCPYTPTPSPFLEELLEEGKKFEEKIVCYLKEKYPNDIKTVASSPEDLYNPEKMTETKRLMEEKVPIIYQGVLVNEDKEIGGICDLLIRSDFLNKISADHNGIYREAIETSYIVIDIKLSCLSLKTDGIHLKNSRNYTYYKAQLYIYTEALKCMQIQAQSHAYILGRGWEYTKGKEKFSGSNCLERLGKVDFNGEDSFIKDRVKNAIAWIRNLRIEGDKWSLFPPSTEELRPNMAIHGGKWQNAKLEIAEKQNDITLLLSCGHSKRKLADKAGINSWKKCNTKVLEIKSEKRKRSIDRSIRVNKRKNFHIVPKKLSEGCKNKLHSSEVELYLDYETFYNKDEMVGIDAEKGRTVVFLIGCGFVVNDIWTYKSFLVEKIDIQSERKQFSDFLSEIGERKFKIYSWGPTEKNIYEKLTDDYSLFSGDKYVDLLKLFRDESISMTGCFSYSLKDIAKAMYSNECINTIWKEDSSIKNGYEAMKEGEKLFLGDNSKLSDLINYNEVDCKIMWEIVSFLRKM